MIKRYTNWTDYYDWEDEAKMELKNYAGLLNLAIRDWKRAEWARREGHFHRDIETLKKKMDKAQDNSDAAYREFVKEKSLRIPNFPDDVRPVYATEEEKKILSSDFFAKEYEKFRLAPIGESRHLGPEDLRLKRLYKYWKGLSKEERDALNKKNNAPKVEKKEKTPITIEDKALMSASFFKDAYANPDNFGGREEVNRLYSFWKGLDSDEKKALKKEVDIYKKKLVDKKISEKVDDLHKKAKKEPKKAKAELNSWFFDILEAKNEKVEKKAYWGGTKTPQNTASLTHRLRVGHLVSDYANLDGDSKPGERYNCRCTVYFK